MASFDYKTFLAVQGQGGVGAFDALGMGFGMPTCLLNLADNLLQILPSDILGEMRLGAMDGKLKANEVTSWIFRKLTLDTGIIEFDTETGTFKFKSLSSANGNDANEGGFLNNLNGVLGAFSQAAAFGSQIYQNYTDISNYIDAAMDCLDKFQALKSYEAGNSALQKNNTGLNADQMYAAEKSTVATAMDYINKANGFLTRVDTILAARAVDPSLEPKFLDSKFLDEFLANTNYPRFPEDDPTVNDGDITTDDGIFRLVYGPPISVKGKYLLTSDGLYYDSQAGGLDPIFLAVSGTIPFGEKWKFNYDPNLGGKGQIISVSKLDQYKDTLFDPDIIDESAGLEEYYNEDHFLQTLRQQRDKHVYDLSASLQTLIDNPSYGEGTSVVKNMRQQIISEIANHNHKIRRRKKQIEVLVKAPAIYESTGSKLPPFKPGEIPINDFSFLKNFNFSIELEKQKKLILDQSEVNGVVLPIKAKFVQVPDNMAKLNLDQLNVPLIGKGTILYTPSGVGSGTILSLTDSIVTDSLIAVYNFLETKVSLPSSLDFNTTNCATPDNYNNAQLIAPNASSVFFSGLGVPYLRGIVNNSTDVPTLTSSLGSVVRLPDTKEYRELMYSQSGMTMECWVHVPNLTNDNLGWGNISGSQGLTLSSLTKVLIACENTGHKAGTALSSIDLDKLPPNFGDNYVRGLICGFTRDRRITQEGTGYSNFSGQNMSSSSLSFFLAPTISRDLSSLSWVNNISCQNSVGFHKMKVDASAIVNTKNYGAASGSFIQVAFSISPKEGVVKLFCDGVLMATSSIEAVFGKNTNTPPELPSMKKENSFNYTPSTVNGPTSIRTGPILNQYFTPWIIGGGYTDGMYQYGNFMGGDRGGVVSGFKGFVGSLKFYSKALNTGEIKQNYDSQQGFFKSILV